MKHLGFVVVVAVAILSPGLFSPALGGLVPPVSPADFAADAAASEAHPVWLILAGEGFWGAIVVGLAGFAYRFLRPYVLAWLEERKLAKLFLAAEACVARNNALYVEQMKAANADGRLTEDEAAVVFRRCRENLVEFMRSQGVDIVKEYGDLFVDAIIELIVARLKNPLARAVAAPLSASSASAPLPPSV